MNAPQVGLAERLFAQFLELERQARAAGTVEQLAYHIVNDGQALFGYRHAALLIAGKVQALTGISVVEPNAPFVAFVEQACAQLQRLGALDKPQRVDFQALGAQQQADWQALSAGDVFWLPLADQQGAAFGGLWLAREQPWSEAEQALLVQLGDRSESVV